MEAQELERIKAVKRFEKFDFALNKGIQNILKMAAEVYDAPAAFITLIDEHDQWFKVRHGFEILNMPRETSFCTHTILRHEPLIVCDALEDEKFANSPFVKDVPNIRFYAGAALSDYDGQNIGTLCIMDIKPKTIPEDKKKLLVMLAKQAIHLMELDMNYQCMSDKLDNVARQNVAFREISYAQSKDLDEPLNMIMKSVNLVRNNDTHSGLHLLENAVNNLNERLDEIKRALEEAKKIYTPAS